MAGLLCAVPLWAQPQGCFKCGTHRLIPARRHGFFLELIGVLHTGKLIVR